MREILSAFHRITTKINNYDSHENFEEILVDINNVESFLIGEKTATDTFLDELELEIENEYNRIIGNFRYYESGILDISPLKIETSYEMNGTELRVKVEVKYTVEFSRKGRTDYDEITYWTTFDTEAIAFEILSNLEDLENDNREEG